jgi:hypothetical protein
MLARESISFPPDAPAAARAAPTADIRPENPARKIGASPSYRPVGAITRCGLDDLAKARSVGHLPQIRSPEEFNRVLKKAIVLLAR